MELWISMRGREVGGGRLLVMSWEKRFVEILDRMINYRGKWQDKNDLFLLINDFISLSNQVKYFNGFKLNLHRGQSSPSSFRTFDNSYTTELRFVEDFKLSFEFVATWHLNDNEDQASHKSFYIFRLLVRRVFFFCNFNRISAIKEAL